MGAIPRTLWGSDVRSVLLALLTALAWLAWGAGTATASSLVPDSGELGNLSEPVLTPGLPLVQAPLPLPLPDILPLPDQLPPLLPEPLPVPVPLPGNGMAVTPYRALIC